MLTVGFGGLYWNWWCGRIYCMLCCHSSFSIGSSALKVLRGPAHFGSVVSGEAQRGKYEPFMSKCNFPVPSYRMIQNIDTGYPKVLKPGLIECTLDICEELAQLHQKQFVLSFDGMQVAPGSKGVSDGNVDLLGAKY